MFFFLSKLIYIFLMPISWLIFLLIWLVGTKNPTRKKQISIATLALVLVLSNPFIINQLFKTYEYPLVSMNELKPTELGIILTGFTRQIPTDDERVFMNQGGDRATHAVYLYNRKIIKKILVSGGSGSLVELDEPSESRKVKGLLVEMGVKPADILTEERSRNTHENAKYTAQILNELSLHQTPILLTSAFHMRRAQGCFEKQGVEVVPFVGDIQTKRVATTANDFLPSEGAIQKWGRLIHEITGLIVYELMGYT